MKTIEKINFAFGEGKVKVGSAFSSDEWHANAKLVSKRYTTHWNELLEIKI
jgi:hypothetical protein